MKKTIAIVSIALAAVIVSLLAGRWSLVKSFGLKSLDRQFARNADPGLASKKIILVEVDQASLDHFEKDNIAFPWPRSLYNPIINYASAGGARAILFDILFNNISPYGMEVDEEFASAIRDNGKVSLAAAFMKNRTGKETKALDKRFTIPYEGVAPDGYLKNGVSLPLPAILEAVHRVGTVIFRPDSDGVYRRVALAVKYGDELAPALFAVPVFDTADKVEFTDGGVNIGKYSIPLDENGDMLINYLGSRGTYQRYPAAAVISSAIMEQSGQEPTVPKQVFKDSVVIVGYTAPGLFDLKPNPLSPVSPGIEIYASALDTILGKRHIRILGSGWLHAIAFAGALAVSAGVLLIPSVIVVGFVVAIAAWIPFILSSVGFSNGMWINLVPVEIAVFVSLAGSAIWKYETEGKKKREIHRAFGYYVSPAVIEQMLAEPERLKLGGEKKRLTLLFSDLEGFTPLSERLEPKKLVELLNEYTTLMANTVTAYDGTVDKYIGDAVMAFWGAPLDQDDQEIKACYCALLSQEKLEQMSRRLVSEGLPPVNIRIGLNSGECVVGNMGSETRFDYTALGDPVNQAARLEGLNKIYGTKILAAEPTWEIAKKNITGREIDFLKVKGKDEPVRVFEIVARRGRETEAQLRLIKNYEPVWQAYKQRRWDDVIELAGIALNEAPDGPTQVLLDRAVTYKQNPPPDDWDGSFRHTSK